MPPCLLSDGSFERGNVNTACHVKEWTVSLLCTVCFPLSWSVIDIVDVSNVTYRRRFVNKAYMPTVPETQPNCRKHLWP